MAYEVDKELPCDDCGQPTYRRLNVRKTPLCVLCAIKRSNLNMIQIARHEGEYYDRWVSGMRKFADRLAGGSGVSPNLHWFAAQSCYLHSNAHTIILAGVVR